MDGWKQGLAAEEPLIWQRVICWGDSQTFGSRMPVGVPEVLADYLTGVTEMEWVAVNRAVPGETILQLLRRFEDGWVDSAFQTVLIGANDARDGTDPVLFRELATQMVRKLRITGVAFAWAKIPMIARLGHAPYMRSVGNVLVQAYNEILEDVVPEGCLVTPLLAEEDFVDGVHLRMSGLLGVAQSFAANLVHR